MKAMLRRRSDTEHQRSNSGAGESPGSVITRLLIRWEVGLCLLIFIIAAVCSAISSDFLTPFNLETMALNATVLGFLALGVAPVIMTGDIDLSIASTLALCGVFMAVLWQHGMSIWLAAALAIILGCILGLVNGLIVVFFSLPSLAVTLGTMSTYTGIAFLILQGKAITNFPADLVALGSGGLFGSSFPTASIVLLLFAAALAFVIHRTTLGKAVFAIGGNREAARFSGLPVRRTRIILFVIAGAFSALAAIFYLGNFDTAQANMAVDQLLPAVTVVILGGVSAYGGTGTIPGVVLALTLLEVLEAGLSVVGLSGQEQTISVGLLLVVAISGGAAIRSLQGRLRRKFWPQNAPLSGAKEAPAAVPVGADTGQAEQHGS
jgi:rhamnose transport system permease protein